jgi:hypothetical protein
MAGVQIDGVNNKIDFDDDQDTSISANTDDTLVIEAGGNTLATFTATTLTINDGTTITTADNTDTLTLKSTDADGNSGPILRLNRDSGSPADGDVIGEIHFNADDDAGNTTSFFSMSANIRDASNGDEDVQMVFKGFRGGSNVNYLEFDGDHVVFNEGSADIDFRVESNGDANRFVVDGGTDTVLFGTATADTVGGDVVANQIFGTGAATGALSIVRGVASTASGSLVFGKTRNTTYGSRTVVQDGDRLGNIIFHGDDGSDLNSQGAIIAAEVDGTPGSNDMPGRLLFLTTANGASSSTERMRIEEDGHVAIGHTTTNRMFLVKTPASYSEYAVQFDNASSSAPYGILNNYSGAAPDTGSDNEFFIAMDTGATRCTIFSDGDIKNHDNSYGALSDERIKQDIRDSNSQWDDIKAVKVRNFKKKDDVRQYGDNAWEQIGVIAQELETVSPKLIRKHNPNPCDIISNAEFGTLYTSDDSETQDAVLYSSDDQEVINGDKNVGDIKTPSTKQIGDVKEIKEQVKSVNYSVLYMKAIKALQEAMTKIEDLQARVTTLEG